MLARRKHVQTESFLGLVGFDGVLWGLWGELCFSALNKANPNQIDQLGKSWLAWLRFLRLSGIEKAGGRVVFDGYANHRVYAKNARYPGLNMSRCIGDVWRCVLGDLCGGEGKDKVNTRRFAPRGSVI